MRKQSKYILQNSLRMCTTHTSKYENIFVLLELMHIYSKTIVTIFLNLQNMYWYNPEF